MNDLARRVVMDRMRDRRDYARRDRTNYNMMHDGRGNYSGEFRGEYEHDGRRGVKGTGRYGIGGSRHYMDDRRDMDDYDYEEDMRRDYGPMRLHKEDMREWKHKLINADGSMGEHFNKDQIEGAAERVGIRYHGYDEKELCMTANMLYSDLGEVLKMYIPQDKEALVYVKMARAWLEDEDGPEGSEKLAAYYYCVVEDDKR